MRFEDAISSRFVPDDVALDRKLDTEDRNRLGLRAFWDAELPAVASNGRNGQSIIRVTGQPRTQLFQPTQNHKRVPRTGPALADPNVFTE